MSTTFIRVNGRGNAWPVFVGQSHRFYDTSDPDDLGNASYSIINSESGNLDTINWEIVVDAGNNTVSYIIRNENRIPEAIVLTHPHMDHALGVDWIAWSYYFKYKKKKKYPVYATKPCFNFVIQSYPHLVNLIEHKELFPGVRKEIEEVQGLNVTPFPVFHGNSGYGASMLVFEQKNLKAVFTGDMLCPLLRKKDYDFIYDAKVIYMDTNNRFCYPLSNHECITTLDPNTGKQSKFLDIWMQKISITELLNPHLQNVRNKSVHLYFQEFIKDFQKPGNLTYSIFDFLKKVNIPNVNLIHYGGQEDDIYYKQEILDQSKLCSWASKEAKKLGLNNNFIVPEVGERFVLKS